MTKDIVIKITSITVLVITFIISVNCGILSSNRRVHVGHHRSPRQIQRYSGLGSHNGQEEHYERPEKGQILHRPKSTDKHRNIPSSQKVNSMPEGAPMILNGRGKSVKYVPTAGFSGNSGKGAANHRPPQVYVISGGSDEEEDQGMMGSMQSYFRSMTGRIKAAMQGLIGSGD